MEQKNDKLKTYAVKVFEGEVMYSAVNGTVNEWEGKPTGYVLNLKVTSKEVEKLKKLATELIENAKKDTEFKSASGTKVSANQWLPTEFMVNKLIKEKDGVQFINCKAKHEREKDGVINRVFIPVYDKDNHRLAPEEEQNLQLAYDAKIAVNLYMRVVFTNLYQGVSIRLKDIQLLDDDCLFKGGNGGSPFEPVKDADIDEDVPI